MLDPTHDVEDLQAVRDLLREFAEQVGYLQLDRDNPRPGKLGRFEWDAAKAIEKGLLDRNATADDLPDAAIAWMEGHISADATPNEKVKYRIRLAQPGGAWIKQQMITAMPITSISTHTQDQPMEGSSATEHMAIQLLKANADESRRLYRDIIFTLKDMLLISMRESAASRANVTSLFDTHVTRELSLIDRERERAKEEREAQAAGGGDLFDGISKVALQLWAVQNDIPPELVEVVAKDDELKHLLNNPNLLKKLTDPTMRNVLKQLSEQ